MGYIICSLCIASSTWLALEDKDAWTWFLVAGLFLGLSAIGSDIKRATGT